MNEDSLELIRKDAGLLPIGSLMGMIGDMAELSARVRASSQKRVLLEVELIRMAGVPARGTAPAPAVPAGPAAVPAAERTAITPLATETSPAKEAEKPAEVSEQEKKPAPTETSAKAPAEAPKEKLSNIGEKLEVIRSRWNELTQQLTPSNRVLFGGVELTEAKGGIVVVFKNRINYTLASKSKENGLIQLEEIARKQLGIHVPFLARQAKPGEFPEAKEKITDEDIKKINFPVDIEN